MHDIVVLGTDGLWDNLFDDDVKSVIEARLKGSKVFS